MKGNRNTRKLGLLLNRRPPSVCAHTHPHARESRVPRGFLHMNTNGILSKHWMHVAAHFGIDVLLFFSAFVLGEFVRFGDEAPTVLFAHWPFMLFGGISLGVVTYIAGLYSTHSTQRGVFE